MKTKIIFALFLLLINEVIAQNGLPENSGFKTNETLTTYSSADAELALEQSVDNLNASVGSIVNFTIVSTNNGPVIVATNNCPADAGRFEFSVKG